MASGRLILVPAFQSSHRSPLTDRHAYGRPEADPALSSVAGRYWVAYFWNQKASPTARLQIASSELISDCQDPPVHAGGPLHDPIFLGRLAPWWCVRRTLFSEVSNRGRK